MRWLFRSENIWGLRREFSYSLQATGMTRLNEDVVVPRSKLVNLVRFCESLKEKYGQSIACFGHAGDGNIHTNIMVADYSNPEVREKADQCVDELFRWVINEKGSITGEHGIGLAKAKWFGEAIDANALLMHKTLKNILDPRQILNPGKMSI